MVDENERVDWSALMDAHGIDPDADTASPTVEPKRLISAPEPAGQGRLFRIAVTVTALFSIAASVAVLVVLLRGGEDDDESGRDTEELLATGPRPAAFQHTSDGVAVVPTQVVPPPESPPLESPPPRETPEVAKPAADKPAADKPAVAKPETRVEAKPSKRAEKETPAAKGAATDEKKEEPAAAPEPADPNLPDEPDQAAVTSSMEKLQKEIEACAAKSSVTGEVGIKMRIEPDGSVAWASAKLQNSPFQSCLDRVFKKARMPKSAKGATVRQSLQLP